MIEYKGYHGEAVFDDEAGIFHGPVIGTRDVITLQGKSAAETESAFRDSIDEYLNFCAERGRPPGGMEIQERKGEKETS
jgi:predicted HicB family RNase H-like nuclease